MDTYRFSNIQKEEPQGKVVYYHDRFFVGDVSEPIVFSVCISKHDQFSGREIDLDIGSIGANGFSFTLSLDDVDQKEEALQIVSKLASGLDNLLSALKRMNKDG